MKYEGFKINIIKEMISGCYITIDLQTMRVWNDSIESSNIQDAFKKAIEIIDSWYESGTIEKHKNRYLEHLSIGLVNQIEKHVRDSRGMISLYDFTGVLQALDNIKYKRGEE